MQQHIQIMTLMMIYQNKMHVLYILHNEQCNEANKTNRNSKKNHTRINIEITKKNEAKHIHYNNLLKYDI